MYLGSPSPCVVLPRRCATPATRCTRRTCSRAEPSTRSRMAHAEEIGFPLAIVDRARAAVASLPSDLVYVGFSLGVLSAQSLAQTRPGASGALLCYSALPLGES